MADIHPAPPFNPELKAALEAFGNFLSRTLILDMIPALNASVKSTPVEDLITGRPIVYDERTIPGPAGAPDLTVSIFKRVDYVSGGPGVYHTHGGGVMMGGRFTSAVDYLDWVMLTNAVVVSVEYRRAPAHPDPEFFKLNGTSGS